jgi:hypothetical protein
MRKLIDKIFALEELRKNPPVLIDIGASGQLNNKWKKISKYSICLAFDADDRDFQFIEKEQSIFKKLYIFNSIALDSDQPKADFYLTKSPYCSSTLLPDKDGLKPYINSQLFKVEKKVELNTIYIQKALNEVKLDYVDWYKSDSQGMDLRLFKSLDEKIRSKVILTEFEPGIIDAYIGEDKLYSVIQELTNSGFWLSEMQIKGVPRLPKELLDSEFVGNIFKKLITESLQKAPGWGELTFINSFEYEALGSREFILGWLFSTLENHHSFAFVLAKNGFEKYRSEIFSELEQFSKYEIKKEVYRLKFLPALLNLLKKKITK